MFTVDKKDLAQEALVNLLKKLGIKSADVLSVKFTLDHLVNAMQGNFGTPDKVYMDPQSYKALSTFLRPNTKQVQEDN